MLAYLRAPLEIWRISGRLLGRAGVDDALGDLHVVDVERADGEPAVVGEVEHRLGGHQRHRALFLSAILQCPRNPARALPGWPGTHDIFWPETPVV